MVFDSVARYYGELHAEDSGQSSLPHIIISNLEHDSVDITARKMEQQGRIGEYYFISWSGKLSWFFVLSLSIILSSYT